MNNYLDEIRLILLVVGVLGIAYAFIYPHFAKDNIKILAFNDLVATLVCLAGAGYCYYDSGETFRLMFFKLNWFWFTLSVYILIELPFSYLYARKYILKRVQQK